MFGQKKQAGSYKGAGYIQKGGVATCQGYKKKTGEAAAIPWAVQK